MVNSQLALLETKSLNMLGTGLQYTLSDRNYLLTRKKQTTS